jgi:hypothetical protein
MAERSNIPLAEGKAAQAAERIYHEWDAALGAKDLDAAMALYAPDCVLDRRSSGTCWGQKSASSRDGKGSGNSCASSLSGNPQHGNAIARAFSRTGIS